MNEYKIIIVPDEERLTLDVISSLEIASIMSNRISQITKDMVVYLPDDFRYVNTSTLNDGIKKNIPQTEVVKNGHGTFVKLSSTNDIVSGEINTGNIPYLIHRTISVDHNKRIIYVEPVDPNTLSRPVLKYFTNHST